jgi:hypothetical protein
MKKYVVYFELFEKKLKAEVTATSHSHAKELVQEMVANKTAISAVRN